MRKSVKQFIVKVDYALKWQMKEGGLRDGLAWRHNNKSKIKTEIGDERSNISQNEFGQCILNLLKLTN